MTFVPTTLSAQTDFYAIILVPLDIASKYVTRTSRHARLIAKSNAKCIMILLTRPIPSATGVPAFRHTTVAMAVWVTDAI